MTDDHACHKSELPKLNRISGQVDGIKKMIEEARYCPDILTQLRAVRSALKSVEASVLEGHLQSCVKDAMISGDEEKTRAKIEELKTMFKRFDE